ncbi:trehalose-phosphatase [Novosphingobium taihuense]|uniref:Trehalose 6-phosphate phosphatase n=1 Tax=Novosphingobium taihuense TaxID=260085 RepID=A0A7W7AG05_9SPHN|nr:trehalose-phosphatase [Novosphingobium taihuense]MBB4615342.1 trehalose 6-phosphate phosphatase [Novosphingobium taihuense]TWH84377.1 trehalose 6-phosphatase [Novosphingobium taihuense]
MVLHEATLFLDLDGTLFELVDSPEDVRADHRTQALIGQLMRRMDGRVAVVSGRSLAQIDDMLGDAAGTLWISGSHGCEHRWDGVIQSPSRPAALDDVAASFRDFAQDRPGVLVEQKSLGVALHYRLAPEAGASALTLAQELADLHDLYLQHGKSMVELRVGTANKGSAILAMMGHPRLAGTTPVFAGDDVTDEPGFKAVLELGGHAILVGEPRPTLATFGLRSPEKLREWLWRATA